MSTNRVRSMRIVVAGSFSCASQLTVTPERKKCTKKRNNEERFSRGCRSEFG